MPSKRETILQRIVTALAGTAGVGSRIYRSRVVPLARGEAPAIVVEPVSDSATQDTLGTLQWNMTVRVAVIVRGEVPDQLADAVIVDVHSKLMGDATLGGYVIDMLPTTVSFESIEADQPAGVVSAEFAVTYRTALNSLS
jgi:hypothetical protein